MRTSLCVLTALAFAAPLAAQQQAGGMAGMNHDATNVVKGSGKLPDGWNLRFDPQRDGKVPALDAVNFVTMGSGYHFTSGPAAIYYNSKDVGAGEYSVTATFSQRKSVGHTRTPLSPHTASRKKASAFPRTNACAWCGPPIKA